MAQQINLKPLLAGDGQLENIEKLNFNFGQISEFGGGPPGVIGLDGKTGIPGGRGPSGNTGPVGPRGTIWNIVDVDPTAASTPTAVLYDLIFNRLSGHLFEFDGTTWKDQGKLVGDGTYTEKDGAVYYNLPLYQNVIKSLVLSPIDYKTLNISPLSNTFRPVVKLLSNNLANAFLTIGAVDNSGTETPLTKQVGMYLDKIGTSPSDTYDFILSNASGNTTLEAGPNHFKIGKDNTYRFTTAGQYDRLLIDLSDLNERHLLFGGDGTGNTKFRIGSSKDTTYLLLNDLGNVGINQLIPQAKLHVNADPVGFAKGTSNIAQIFSANVGGGNISKLQVEISRVTDGIDTFETDSIMNTIARVDGNTRSGFVGFVGGQTNTAPQVVIGINDVTVAVVDKKSLNVIGNVIASNSMTIGSRIGVVGLESFTVGGTVTASMQGSVAIGDNSSSTHKNAVVIGAGATSQIENSLFNLGRFGVKNGTGALVGNPFFTSFNPNTFNNNNVYGSMLASFQHDGSTDGVEIVSYGPANTTIASGTSFAVTRSNTDGTAARNMFSVGVQGVSIGNAPVKFVGQTVTATNFNFYQKDYSLSVDNNIVFNSTDYTVNMTITGAASQVGQSLNGYYGLVKKGSIVLQGADIFAANSIVEGGNIVIIPGVGNRDSMVEYNNLAGNVVIGHDGTKKVGKVFIGKSIPNGNDSLQISGTTYFDNPATTGTTIISAVSAPVNAGEQTTAVSGFANSQSKAVRQGIENNHTVVGKLGYVQNSNSFDPVNDIHQTNEYGVYGAIGSSATSPYAHAAYFENNSTAATGAPTVVIRSNNTTNAALFTIGAIRSTSNMMAEEFVPNVGWIYIPFQLLTARALVNDSRISGLPGTSDEILIGTTPFPFGNPVGQNTTASFKAFRYGNLVHVSFHFTIVQQVQPSSTPDSYVVFGLPIFMRSATLGSAYAYGTTRPDATTGVTTNLEQFIAVTSKTVGIQGAIQFLLPKGDAAESIWGTVPTLHLTGTLVCNANMTDFIQQTQPFFGSGAGTVGN